MSGHIVDGQVMARHVGLPNGLRWAWWLTRCLVRVLIAVGRAVLWLAWRLLLLALAAIALPFSRRAAGWCLRRAFSGGRQEGKRLTGERRTENDAPVKVHAKPKPLQSVAQWNRSGPDWLVEHLIGMGLVTMFYAGAGVGKTELLFGMLREAFDGRAFCGLKTRKPRRVLLLTEQDPASLEPVAVRWGFALKPTGRLDQLRRRWLSWTAPGGHTVTMVTASEMFAPQGDGRRPTWRDACQWAIAYAKGHGFDVLIVDSLQRWMGGDVAAQTMLDALGDLRQGTEDKKLAAVVLHHPPRSGGHARGASQIDGEVDFLWRMARREGAPVTDPVRLLTWDKHRFQDDAPDRLTIERVYDRMAPGGKPTYRLVGGPVSHETPGRGAPERTPAGPVSHETPAPALSPQQQAVLDVLTVRGTEGATKPQAAKLTGISPQRADEAINALVTAGLVNAAGTVRPPRGGPAATRYVAGASEGIMHPESPVTPGGTDVATVIEAFLHDQAAGGTR
jgi:hypothetical protein